MAFHLARRKQRLSSNPSLVKLLSTSSSDPPPRDDNASDENPSQSSTSSSSSSSSPSQFSFSSYFSDVKAHLREKTAQQQNGRKSFARSDFNTRNPGSFSSPSKQSGGVVSSLEEIRNNLSKFRQRSGPPPPGNSGVAPSSQSQPTISFQELYKRNVMPNSSDSSAGSGTQKLGNLDFGAIRESLRQMRSMADAKNSTERQVPARISLSRFQESLKMKPSENVISNVIGGTEALPPAVFAREKEQEEAEKGTGDEMEEKPRFLLRTYSPEELGEKLRLLRPEGKKQEGWHTLQELNERLIKLREMEDKEASSQKGARSFLDLRSSLQKMSSAEAEKKNKAMFKRLDILNTLGGTPSYMLHPPKEHLVETYFHPDNMSSEEKMKIELAKVRDEFKMAESDCGSARVQVAQLTTKIKHLSSVLHKKDKHSREGLQGMVQKRKKLLKYLRRTDWDSYCLVLSKLGLRDNPDSKLVHLSCVSHKKKDKKDKKHKHARKG